MATYYVTFGQRYRHEEHPAFPDANPDGWFEIEAPDISEARLAAHAFLTDAWSFIYSEEDFATTRHLYPLGALAVVAVAQDEEPTMTGDVIDDQS